MTHSYVWCVMCRLFLTWCIAKYIQICKRPRLFSTAQILKIISGKPKLTLGSVKIVFGPGKCGNVVNRKFNLNCWTIVHECLWEMWNSLTLFCRCKVRKIECVIVENTPANLNAQHLRLVQALYVQVESVKHMILSQVWLHMTRSKVWLQYVQVGSVIVWFHMITVCASGECDSVISYDYSMCKWGVW